MRTLRLATGALACAMGAAAADMIDTDGMAPWERCAYCHGLDGNSGAVGIPRLGGQPAAYLDKQLDDFRAGRRGGPHHPMRAVVESLGPEEQSAVVGYFASQPPPDGGALGPLFHSGAGDVPACASCHGAEGAGQGERPRLAGQRADYLRRQLEAFRSGERRNDEGVMAEVARGLSDEQIERVTETLGGVSQ